MNAAVSKWDASSTGIVPRGYNSIVTGGKMTRTEKLILKKLDLTIFLLKTILRKEHVMSQELEALQAQVQQNEDLEASAITLIQGIANQLAAAKEDPAKIQELADGLKASAANLSAAIVANTQAET